MSSGFAQFGTGGAIMYAYSGINAAGQGYAGSYIVGTDAKVTAGQLMEPQAGSPFSNVSVSGNYSGGTVNPVLSAVTNSVTSLFADGVGNVTGTQYTTALDRFDRPV